jgi:transposase
VSCSPNCPGVTTWAKAFNYILKRWPSFALFLEEGRVCLSNNAAERGLRGIALGRKAWLFCGSGRRAAAMYSLTVMAKMNGIDPQASLTDVLGRISAHPVHRLDELLPRHWTPLTTLPARAA